MRAGAGAPSHGRPASAAGAPVRVTWLRGRIAAAESEVEEAETLPAGTRESFVADTYGFDAALVSLDLALLYFQQRRRLKP